MSTQTVLIAFGLTIFAGLSAGIGSALAIKIIVLRFPLFHHLLFHFRTTGAVLSASVAAYQFLDWQMDRAG